MTDRAVVLLAGAVVLAAFAAVAVPWAVVVPLALWGLVRRRPAVVGLALVAGVGTAAAAAQEGLTDLHSGRVEGVATVWADPEGVPGGVRTTLRLDGRHLAATATAGAARVLAGTSVGERVAVTGRLRVDARPDPWMVARHLGGHLDVEAARRIDAGAWPFRLADRVRTTLTAGSASMSTDDAALFSGLVVGDDRHQDDAMGARFRASGLAHLTAVSGQNVAFVLLVLRPILVRLGLWARWSVSMGALLLFALVTRWEPSVLRAVAMAAVGISAWTLGRHVRPGRIVALVVVAVVALDPLIVHSLGFRLSVAATVALVTLAGPLARRIGGPRWLALALAVVLAAQVGTTPLLMAAGASWSPASVPANLLAGPVAGAVMMWGLVGGLAAGVVGGAAAEVLHLPTRAMLWWIDGVARAGAHPRWPEWPPALWVAVTAVGAGAVVVRGRARRRVAAVAVVVAVVGASLITTVGPLAPRGVSSLGRGARIDRVDGVTRLVLTGQVPARAVLDGVTRRGCPDVVVVASGGARPASLAAAVADLCGPAPVVIAERPP